jgi:hypothetical protein
MQVSRRARLSLILWLVALHSTAVACGLILLPPEQMHQFGYSLHHERFFEVQAGVFHLVLVVAYSLSAARPHRYTGLVLLSIIAKFMATVFLFTYYLFVDAIWMVLFSGVADLLMGLLILWAFVGFKNSASVAGGLRSAV